MKILIGVKSDNYVLKSIVKIKTHKRLSFFEGNTLLYDKNGEPIMGEATFEIKTFNNKKYATLYDDRHHLTDVENEDIYKFFEGKNLTFCGGRIGMMVKNDGLSSQELNEQFAKARNLLAQVGITEEPKLYLVEGW